MNAISASIDITPRNEHFDPDNVSLRDWHSGDPAKSIIFNALSILFPDGERFFMDSVRAFKSEITDPILKQQVAGFLTQEALHTREHVGFNARLEAEGYSVTKLYQNVKAKLDFVRKRFSAKRQLAITCSLEHFTAMMADLLLRDPVFFEGADETYRKMWLWHAIEEAEHKGVAYDVFQEVTNGKGYFLRCRAMIATTIIFNMFIFYHVAVMMKDMGLSRSPSAWFRVLNYLLGKPGFFRRMAGQWFAYFKPGFHPWDHDNRVELKAMEAELRFNGEPTGATA